MSDQQPTIKQEMFVHIYVETGNASEAYRSAYNVAENTKPETVWANASKLLASTTIANRIMKLQEEMRERHDVNVARLTRELDADRALARENKQCSAAIAAVMNKAKLHGLITDRKEVSGPEGKPIQTEEVAVICPHRRASILEMVRREAEEELAAIKESNQLNEPVSRPQ